MTSSLPSHKPLKPRKQLKNYYCTEWTLSEIKTEIDLLVLRRYIEEGYNYASMDTETTGLHIVLDKPFSIQISIVNMTKHLGKAYTLNVRDKTPEFLQQFKNIVLQTKVLVFWNAKFDLHMLYNIGINMFDHPHITDGRIYARLASDALTPKDGGVVLKLKDYSQRMLDSDAKNYESQVAAELRKISIKRSKRIRELGYSVSKIEEFIKDKINDINDLPKEVVEVLNDPQYDSQNYANVPWEVLSRYGAYDTIFTIENYIRDYVVVERREQLPIALKEEKLIPVLWKTERYGFKPNFYYLHKSKNAVRNYIIERRAALDEQAGEHLKCSQNKRIIEIFKDKFDIDLEKADRDTLNEITEPQGAYELAQTIVELRTLEKYYSTYICKWDEYSSKIGRIYSSFDQCGAVSGRFTSDFQQFPKDAIYTKDGVELYVPRKLVSVSGGDYDELCLIDYAAEELRIQAMYTILINHPDLNLCRAYLPINCTLRDGKYYLNEDLSKEWKPTDLHTLTTLIAFPNITEDDPDFKHYRSKGKHTNFACNYGAGVNTIMTQVKVDLETATRLYNAYNTAFPGIRKYKEYVKNILKYQDYVTNLFGRRFYNCSYHHASNYLIQGSGADLLKSKLIEIDEFLEEHHYKSRMLCTIHDEIMFEIHKDEHFLCKEFQRILEDVPNSPIPFKAEISISHTTWDAKKAIKE